MKNIILLFLFLVPAFLFAQYPTTGNKSRLGWQTTGDGLIWRGVAGDTVNKPNNRNFPYFQLDTVNAVLYRYIATQGNWQAVGGGAVDIDSLIYATRFWVNSNFFPLQGGTLTGTGGNGFVGFPLQSSPPSTPSTGFSLFAGSTGNNISWMQPDGFFRRLISPMTGTPRQYQFMARSYTLGDSADIANNVTSIAANYIATSNGTNLVARNLFDNNTYVGVLNSKPWQFGQWTTAGRPSGVTGYTGYNTTGNGMEWYNGTRWAYALESTFARGTSTRIPFFDANGQVSEVSTLRYNHVNGYLYTPNFISPKIETYPDDVYFVSTASSNRIRFSTPAGTDNVLWFYVNNVYKGAFAAGNTQFSINHLNTIYISQQGGTLPYIQVGGTGTSIGIGTTVSPSYHLHIQGTNAIGLPRGTVGNQPGIVSNTTPMRFFTDTAAIGYGDGGVYNFVATRAYARTMKDGNGIISALPSGNVSISEQTRDLRLGLRGFYVDSIYLNSESVPYNTIIVNKAFFPAGGITATTGNSNTVFNGLLNGSHGGFGNYAAHGATITANSSGSNFNNAQGISTVVYGTENQAIGYNIITGSSSIGRNTMYGRNLNANNLSGTVLIGDSLTATANGQVKIGNSLNNSQLFFGQKFIYDYDTYLLQLSAYGTPATTAAALSKTPTNYGVGFATDGTVTSREIKRDTTIYVTDADYDFSAAITTAQIASRFNRVIFWMTTTAAAGSDSELTLHTPDVNLMQVEYLIHSVDEPAGFDNKIVFGTNNAVDSTNGLVTNYFPGAGDGIHIRAGLRSGVYKYRYSN